MLQAVACIALSPAHHAALSDADTPDTLMQLLLPSDEWYYTNHSTKYARYVKFHAARVLVYMGLFQRLGGRVDLFDLKREHRLTVSPPISLRLYTLPYWSNPPFLIFDIRALWRSVLSARVPECQKLKTVG